MIILNAKIVIGIDAEPIQITNIVNQLLMHTQQILEQAKQVGDPVKLMGYLSNDSVQVEYKGDIEERF